MDVRIGIRNVTRELTLEVSQSPEEIQQIVADAMTGEQPVLTLTDTKGRRVLVPTAHVGYIELGEPEARGVGFNV